MDGVYGYYLQHNHEDFYKGKTRGECSESVIARGAVMFTEAILSSRD